MENLLLNLHHKKNNSNFYICICILGIGRLLTSMLKISQFYFSKDDQNKKCEDYPYNGYKNYRECDEEFVYDFLKKLNVIPFWASSNFAEITSKKVASISDRNYISRLATGTMESDCPKPCKISKVCKGSRQKK